MILETLTVNSVVFGMAILHPNSDVDLNKELFCLYKNDLLFAIASDDDLNGTKCIQYLWVYGI